MSNSQACSSHSHKRFCLFQDNLLHGRFLAEITKEVMVDLESSKYQHAEYRISIYGRKTVEWDILAAWVVQNKLASDNVVWLIQVHFLFPFRFKAGSPETLVDIQGDTFSAERLQRWEFSNKYPGKVEVLAARLLKG